MNSKQLNFFIVSSETAEINQFLQENNCVIIEGKSTSSTASSIKNIGIKSTARRQYYLCRKESLDKVFLNELDVKEYYVNVSKSEVVEFDIGGLYKKKELHRSRFYFVTAYFENGMLVTKDPEFITWADRLKMKFKTRFLVKHWNEKTIYFSRHTVDWIGKFSAELKEGGLKLIAK